MTVLRKLKNVLLLTTPVQSPALVTTDIIGSTVTDSPVTIMAAGEIHVSASVDETYMYMYTCTYSV